MKIFLAWLTFLSLTPILFGGVLKMLGIFIPWSIQLGGAILFGVMTLGWVIYGVVTRKS